MYFDKQQSEASKSLHFSNSIKQNLCLIHQSIQSSLNQYNLSKFDESLVFQSSNSNNQSQRTRQIQQNIQLLTKLLHVWDKNQTKSMLIYNQLINKSKIIQYRSSDIFNQTMFHSNLHPLLTYYLQVKLNHSKILYQNSKIIDVWYQFLATEQKSLFDKILFNNLLDNQNLGSWFKKQALQNLFQNYQKTIKGYTKLMVNYFMYGISYIFFYSIIILKSFYEKSKNPSSLINEKQKINRINYIRQNYVERFKINTI